MKLEHYYVNLIDLPEILPFTIKDEENIEKGREVYRFVENIENFDKVHYIGQDNIEGKFYQRFLFSNGGFMEIMQKAPAAVVAHFSDEERAEEFAENLKEVIKDINEEKTSELLANDIKVNREKEGRISYEKWSKLNKVRDSLVG